MGGWLSRVVAEKVVKGNASAIAGILGIGLFTWGTVNLCKESSSYKKAEEE